jgi:hypothetical protein
VGLALSFSLSLSLSLTPLRVPRSTERKVTQWIRFQTELEQQESKVRRGPHPRASESVIHGFLSRLMRVTRL